MQTQQTLVSTGHDPFPALRQQVQDTFRYAVANHTVLFQTLHPIPLYDVFLDKLAPEIRQTYVCHACRSFVNSYGGLVTIDEDGMQRSITWPALDSGVSDWPFCYALANLRQIISGAPVSGVFLSPLRTWGTPVSPPTKAGHVWTHLSVDVPPALRYAGVKLTAGQTMAEKREDHRILGQAVGAYPLALAEQALAVVGTGQLVRTEHIQGVAQWFCDLHKKLSATKHQQRRANLLWRAVATAPPGWCHIGSTMIGTLLDDLKSGLSFTDCKRSFDAKMHPLQYQRPQAAPREGQIDRAEKLVAQLGIASSLERRMASLDDIQEWAWRHLTPNGQQVEEGFFANLRTRAPAINMATGTRTMTWVKFAETVVPHAEHIACWIPAAPWQRYGQLTTAVHPDAPPILQWDSLEHRNPVAWYFYQQPRPPEYWGLAGNTWASVHGLTLMPHQWLGGSAPMTHHGQGMFVVLNGAADSHPGGIGLFPETLKTEYREIRVVIEAYSAKSVLGEALGTPSCGLGFHAGDTWGVQLRVIARGLKTVYTVDRWD